MGKRQIGELQPTELVVTILVSNIATLPLEDVDTPIVMGAVPILTLVCLDVIMSFATLKSRKLRRIVSGTPKIIIKDGNIDQTVLRDLRFSVDDLMAALRGNNIFDVGEVQFAIVETTGSISIYEKYQNRTVTNRDLNHYGKSKNPPELVISDGMLLEKGFQKTGLDKLWLEHLLSREGLKITDIFLLTVDNDGNYNLIRKEC